MNIKFSYLYRDYANYKNHGAVILPNPNAIALKEIEAIIKSHLIDNTWFYSIEWNVPDLHFDSWDPEDDHFLHEFGSVEETEEPTHSDIGIDLFLSQVRNARNQLI